MTSAFNKLLAVIALTSTATFARGQPAAANPRTLDIYWTDVEDGVATLAKATTIGNFYAIKASISEDGSFTVTNTRNNFSKSYTAR